jgi:dTDP-4-amino-4,6-dideoxygalactose transaminase
MSTGGEGGMVTTNDHELWSKMWSYKDHGKSYEAVYEQRDHPSGFRWLHGSFGTNWRMTEMQAALGRIQITRMVEWNKIRRKNAELIWSSANATINLRVPDYRCEGCHNCCDSQHGCVNAAYKCYVFVNGDRAMRDHYLLEINKRGVPCFSGTCSEVYLEKAFDGTGWRPKKPLPTAHELGNTSLAFLCHPSLKQEEINLTCRVITEVCS